jgi:hypothetical protein
MYKYDSRTGQYRGNLSGQFVSRAQIAYVVDETVSNLSDRLASHTNRMIADRLSVAQWQSEMADSLKIAHIQLGLLANGTGTIDKSVSDELSAQFDMLDGFGKSIARGELSVPQIRARARQYANSAKISFYQAEKSAKERSGLKTAKRMLDNQSKHCSDCIRYAGLGYVSIADLISPGTNCECNSGCKCSVVYRYY